MLLACEVPENGFLPRALGLDPEVSFLERIDLDLCEQG
jgi:hypothetical protein